VRLVIGGFSTLFQISIEERLAGASPGPRCQV
jgi:hypothetical protein